VNHSQPKTNTIVYTLFVIPFILAFLSWLYFPSFARTIILHAFGYHANEQVASVLWLGLINFFYTWYTFLAIAAAGGWIIAALLARRKKAEVDRNEFYPMVSFVVPAFNEERNIKPCITSLFKCADEYDGNCEILVVDDGSTDYTYEEALSTARPLHLTYPQVRCKVSRHMVNLGKIEALRTGVNRALGQVIAVVDADSEWNSDALKHLVKHMLANGEKAVTGDIHPKAETEKNGFTVSLQQLEYSQGLSLDRCGQSLVNAVMVIPGAIGVYDACLLRYVMTEANIRSVTEDSEITLAMHKRGARIGFYHLAGSTTVAPKSWSALWRQRLRWFTGWLHNILGIHEDLFWKRSWLSAFLWYSFVFEFVGAFVDLLAVVAFPFLFWFAPDRVNFAFNFIVFAAYGLLLNGVVQAVALKLSYGSLNHDRLLVFAPAFPFLWVVNVFARVRSVHDFLRGKRGKWQHEKIV
jgi:cellulose synthase/poly-beta-1,6-N-acetylglucosamine synthase-like glycosyltransferase